MLNGQRDRDPAALSIFNLRSVRGRLGSLFVILANGQQSADRRISDGLTSYLLVHDRDADDTFLWLLPFSQIDDSPDRSNVVGLFELYQAVE
jgi:hypothetical protein